MTVTLDQLKKRIRKPETAVQYYSILIYGPSGVGKTSLLNGAEDTLILDVEHGTSVLSEDSQVDVFQLNRWEDLQDIFTYLQNGELRFTNIVLDSLTEIQELCKDYVLRTQQRRRVSEDTPSQQDYGVIVEKMRKMLRNFRALKSNVIYIARERHHKDEETGAERVLPDIVGKLSTDLPGAMTVTAYMKADNAGKRYVAFDLTGKYYAKDRTHKFPKILENPTWADFTKALPTLAPAAEQVS